MNAELIRKIENVGLQVKKLKHLNYNDVNYILSWYVGYGFDKLLEFLVIYNVDFNDSDYKDMKSILLDRASKSPTYLNYAVNTIENFYYIFPDVASLRNHLLLKEMLE